jgi:hypothetical protein
MGDYYRYLAEFNVESESEQAQVRWRGAARPLA